VPFHFFLEIQDMRGEAIKRHRLAEAARRQKKGKKKKKAKRQMCEWE